MSPENLGSHFEHQEQVKLKVATPEDIQKVEKSIEYSNKLQRANNVLQVLDFPDNQEEGYRKLLLSEDNKTLETLATKSKEEILTFLVQETKRTLNAKTQEKFQVKAKETEKQNIKSERIERKIAKIKAVFPSSILDSNPDIAKQFKDIDSVKDP